eukprot:2642028-Rhodomonas_salina.1
MIAGRQMDKQHGFGTHWICKDGKLRMQYRGGFANGKRAGQVTLRPMYCTRALRMRTEGSMMGSGWRGSSMGKARCSMLAAR